MVAKTRHVFHLHTPKLGEIVDQLSWVFNIKTIQQFWFNERCNATTRHLPIRYP